VVGKGSPRAIAKLGHYSFILIIVEVLSFFPCLSIGLCASFLPLLSETLVPHEPVHLVAFKSVSVGVVLILVVAELEVLQNLWILCLSCIIRAYILSQMQHCLLEIGVQLVFIRV
jgi:hypothetical protein